MLQFINRALFDYTIISRLNTDKLHINNNLAGKTLYSLPRKCPLAHSDTTGNLFLSIDKDYDSSVLSNWYTEFIRDEALAEWKQKEDEQYLMIYCHISGGIYFSWASLRNHIFRQELPLAIEAICNGDNNFISNNPILKESNVIVNFHSKKRIYNKTEN